jgi:hypothetical protein
MFPFDKEIIRVCVYQAIALYIVGLVIAIITTVLATKLDIKLV